MSNDAPRKKDEGGGGAPAWVMTFADLMSLLMCFFVLLLSFAEMDLNKFKQIAGSMKMAFGVQRDIKVKEAPKGTSVIAREFSPGRPTPTPLIDQIRQNTIDETKQTLEFTDARTDKEDAEGEDSGEQSDSSETAPIQKHTEEHQSEEEMLESGSDSEKLLQIAEMSQQMQQLLEELAGLFSDNLPDHTGNLDQAARLAAEIEQEVNEYQERNKDKDRDKHQVEDEPDNEQTRADARKLLRALAAEIEKGMVSVETEGGKIVIRIKEKGSFPSGSSTLQGDFMPVIDKLRDSLQTIEGRVIVAGHTDNVPIKTHRFRSNWELSSSRAVTVVHELLQNSRLDPKRFAVEGHGEAHPIVPNDTADNRALNRRVELTILQGEAQDQVSEMSSSDGVPGELPGEADGTTPDSGMETGQVEPGNADETVSDSGDIMPITDAMSPVIEDPFAGIDSDVTNKQAESAQGKAEDLTIDLGSLQDKLKTVSGDASLETGEEGEQE